MDVGAATDLDAVKTVWARLRPLVVAQAPARPDVMGAATVANDLDSAIMRCEAALGARDSNAAQAAAQDGLDLVDVVETIFK